MVELRSTPRQSDEVIVYYVQRGDTWRLAKSFTGRGTNGPAVEAAANHEPLRAGTVLRLNRAALPDSFTNPR
jgi:hypothetical protein